jgi:transposase
LSVAKVRASYGWEWASVEVVAAKLGVGTAETLCGCVRHAEVDADQRVGVSSEEHAGIERLKGELAELRRVHVIAPRWSAGSFRPPSDLVLSG